MYRPSFYLQERPLGPTLSKKCFIKFCMYETKTKLIDNLKGLLYKIPTYLKHIITYLHYTNV